MSRAPKPTPQVVLKALRRSPGECPSCKAKLAGNEFGADHELALYTCGSVWRFTGHAAGVRSATCDRACGSSECRVPGSASTAGAP